MLIGRQISLQETALLASRHSSSTDGQNCLLVDTYQVQMDRFVYRKTALFPGRHSSSSGEQCCLQVDTRHQLVTKSMIDPACNLPLGKGTLNTAMCLLVVSCPSGMVGSSAEQKSAGCFCVPADTDCRPTKV